VWWLGGGFVNSEKQKALIALKTCRGQIDGIIKMIDENRYCIDISNQILALQAGIKRANKLVLSQHMNSCVKSAIKNADQADEKIKEITDILNKLL